MVQHRPSHRRSKPRSARSEEGSTGEPGSDIEIDASNKQRLLDANARLDAAELELTRAMEAITVPEQGADNEMIGDRLRAALVELGAARLALSAVLAASP